jgi:hypothetical protein
VGYYKRVIWLLTNQGFLLEGYIGIRGLLEGYIDIEGVRVEIICISSKHKSLSAGPPMPLLLVL